MSWSPHVVITLQPEQWTNHAPALRGKFVVHFKLGGVSRSYHGPSNAPQALTLAVRRILQP